MIQLTSNYRSHQDLLALPSSMFYQGTLLAAADKAITHSLATWMPPNLGDGFLLWCTL